MNIEFIYENEEERKFVESKAIFDITNKFYEEIKEDDRLCNCKLEGDIFNKKIAFTLKKEIYPPYEDDFGNKIKPFSERIILEPINIKEIKLEPITYPTFKKYTFKERLIILFKGHI